MPRKSLSNSGSRSPVRQRGTKRSSTPEKSPPRETEAEEMFKLYVSGLPPDANKDELKMHFEKFGTITDVFVINKQNFSFGFVTFDESKSAKEAKYAMAGKEIGGRNIMCDYARPRVDRGEKGNRGGERGSRGRGRGRGCFKCGQQGHFARECTSGEGQRGNDRPQRREYYKRSESNTPKRRRKSPSGSPPRKRQQGRQSSSSASPQRRPHQRSRSPEVNKARRRSPSSSGSRGRR